MPNLAECKIAIQNIEGLCKSGQLFGNLVQVN
jgi:hypothetical protein